MTCSFVPPYLLRRLAGSALSPADPSGATLTIDVAMRARRTATAGRVTLPNLPDGAAWVVHTADGGTTLPGTPVRSAGSPESGDPAVDEAAYGVTGALALFREAYGRSSYDGAGAPVGLTVHYGRDYANAFWDGTQLVFGDGDGRVFDRFTRPVDVLGHELAHAVTEHTAGLVYEGQPGALNESVSDVFAACLKQRLLGQSAEQGDWLIGAGLFRPGVNARGLRDMAAPGTAYDDPVLGRDPQPAHLDDYVDTTDDNGGVHLNSGIPNRAFHLAAVAWGGTSWSGAGRVWYAALTAAGVGPRTDFAGFAHATVAAAGDRADLVRSAWREVGVEPGVASWTPPAPAGGGAHGAGGGSGAEQVSVRRSGGFAGRTVDGALDLGGGDPRAAEARALVERIELGAVPAGRPYPDGFVYAFDLCGSCATIPEHRLTPDLRRLASLLLDADTSR